MARSMSTDALLAPLFFLWDEIMGENPKGDEPVAVLDRDAGWLQTLARVSAERASQPVVPGGTTIAGQTAHAAYYLELFENIVMNRHVAADWPGSFAPSEVDEQAWRVQRDRLGGVARRVERLLRDNPTWEEMHVRSALGCLVHLAYHLGSVRQMLKIAAA